MFEFFGRWAKYKPQRGDLASVSTDAGSFAVLKVLEVDKGGVHTRLYVQRFATRPSLSDIKELNTAPYGPGHDNPFSIGHMPLSFRAFSAWEPQFLAHGEVVEGELEGYRMWVEAGAGYF